MTTPLLSMAEFQEAEPLAHIIANTNFRILESYAKLRLVSVALATPPGSPAESAMYFIAASPTGAWVGQAGKLTVYIQGAWYFLGAPLVGERFYNVATTVWIQWNGTAWV